MAITKQQETALNFYLDDLIKKTRYQGMRAGACGILSAILDMCDEGKSVKEIKSFCVKSLSQEGMKVR